jgi:hypothetical protein
MADIAQLLNVTRQLAVEVQIPKLRTQIKFMQRVKASLIQYPGSVSAWARSKHCHRQELQADQRELVQMFHLSFKRVQYHMFHRLLEKKNQKESNHRLARVEQK